MNRAKESERAYYITDFFSKISYEIRNSFFFFYSVKTTTRPAQSALVDVNEKPRLSNQIRKYRANDDERSGRVAYREKKSGLPFENGFYFRDFRCRLKVAGF